ncbi:MAG: BspA family leucine-rich repeat surface protein, partial [Candidatus Saccharibacteria bacterium]|nr:BspA family leucine-rich repeat surface protein [Candidatus Saccharibacteria bacterium]
SIFFNDPLFNQDISGWNTSNVTSMGQMFQGASSFNQDISGWNTSKLTSVYYMFADALAFNQDISGWDVSKIETFTGMFVNDPLFNQDISGWNTSSAKSLSWMFSNTTLFNQDISGWNTSNVTDMSYMFYVSAAFNQDISGWNTSNVTDMSYMFTYNAVFNQNISGWNTSKVTDMSYMFKQAYGFNQNLGLWDVSSVTSMTDMFKSVTLPTATYDAILTGWSAETLKNSVTFNAGNSRYCAVEALNAITTNYSWTIQDGGPSLCDTSNDVTLTTTDGIDVIKEGSTGYQTTQTITNNGPLSIDTINFSLDQNDCISITSTSTSGDATTLGSITSHAWTGLLETGQTLTITYNANITCSGGSTITFNNPITSMAYTGFTLTDTNSSNNSDSVDQTLILGVDLRITTTDNLDDILENSTGYQTTQTITNNGPSAIDTLHFSITSSSCLNITGVSTSGTATNTGAYALNSWVGDLESGQSLVLTFDADLTCPKNSTINFANTIDSILYNGVTLDDTNSSNNNYQDSTSIIGPVTDLSVSKVVDNPADLAQGATLQYTLTLKNNGPQAFNLSDFNGSGVNPFETSIFVDILPADLTLVADSSTNPLISCSFLAPTSAAAAYFANHLDGGIVACSYTGAGVLNSDDTISTTISVTVANDSGLNFVNDVFTGWPVNDPDRAILTDKFEGGGSTCEPSQDVIDCYKSQHINNFAESQPITDLAFSMKLVNTQNINSGDTVSYDVSIKNKGPMPIDLSLFNSSSNSLITLIYPGNDLTFDSIADSNISCYDLGAGSAAYLGLVGSSHPNHQLLICSHNDTPEVLNVGVSKTLRLNFVAKPAVGNQFNTYLISNSLLTDPDFATINNYFLNATEDALDTITNENYAKSGYVKSESIINTIVNTIKSGGGLAVTGDSTKLLMPIALIIFGSSLALIARAINKD